jgi:polysaccharide export outer membrane protein
MKYLTLALLAGAALLSACSNGPALTPGPHLAVANAQELPPPTPTDLTAASRPYVVGPFDQIAVSVYGLPELSQTVQIDASGHIALPLVGSIQAAGKTTEQLAREIETQLGARYVRNPQVTVNVTETVSQVATVYGEVRTPGQYPVIGNMTLMRAIASAQGTTEFARLRDVVVFRTVQGQNMAALYNLDAIRRGLYPDPQIYANDVIAVGDSPARRLFRDALQVAPLLTTPLVLLLQNSGGN